jgi:hypothetical protein
MRGGDQSVERESLLTILIVFLGGVTLQLFAAWPWSDGNPSASRRVGRRRWLALWWPAAPRAAGVDAADLAAALVGSLRFQSAKRCTGGVGLIGQPEVVQARIARLLRPLPDEMLPRDSSRIVIAALVVLTLVLTLVLATGLGVACGERVVKPLLALSW